jgi:hypothetical protein
MDMEHGHHAVGDEGKACEDGSMALDELRGRTCVPAQRRRSIGVGGEKRIAPTIELERPGTLGVEGIEEIDAAVHEAHHRVVWPGPVVPVRLGALAARQRQRFA